MSTFTTSYGYLHRYFVRWVTETEAVVGRVGLKVIAWEVCDRKKFDNISLCKFDTQVEAEAVCKLMNSIEEETNA